MAPDPPINTYPYSQETAQNTSQDWLHAHQKLDVSIVGMVDFANNMMVIRDNLSGSTGHLQPLESLPADAWHGALAEGHYVADKMGAHYAELQQLFMYMAEGLQNIGRAAQTIADSYQGTDGWSAASLEAVEFAFGDTSGGQPPGLPPGFPVQTWQQAYDESVSAGVAAQYGQMDQWTENSSSSHGPSTTTVYQQGGLTRTVSTYSNATITQTWTAVTDANGNVLGKSSQRSEIQTAGPWVITTTHNFDGNGNLTGTTQETTTHTGGKVIQEGTTEHAPDGTQESSTDTRIDPQDGSQVIITTTEGGDEAHEVHIGPATPGETSEVLDGPAAKAQRAVGG